VLAGALWHGQGRSPAPPAVPRVASAPEGAIAEAPLPAGAAPAAPLPPRDSPLVPVADVFPLAGEWQVVNTVVQTQYTAYRQLRLTFRLVVRQQGATFTATGVKYRENGRPLPRTARRPLTLQGTLTTGAVVEATFQEAGSARPTHGRCRLTIVSPNHLHGTFASTAARSSGASQWFRVPEGGER
jgi:hypothetical protein